MTSSRYRKALDEATREYEALIEQRAKLDRRIAHLAQSIGHLTRLCGLVPTVPWGLTDACRMVLKAAGHPLTAVEARAQLEAMGFDLSRYTNDLAAIHTVLKRLTDSGEAELVPRAWEKPGYQWRAGDCPPAHQKQPVQTVVIDRAALRERARRRHAARTRAPRARDDD